MSKLRYFKKEGETVDGQIGWFYFEFEDNYVNRQIEVYEEKMIFLDKLKPEEGDHMLGDQSLDFFDFVEEDIISPEEFFEIWNNKSK
jgi:hypothetical protein